MNEFQPDPRIERLQLHNAPESMIKASVWVNDTLDTAQRIAEDAFGDKATPEAVLHIHELIEAKYQEFEVIRGAMSRDFY